MTHKNSKNGKSNPQFASQVPVHTAQVVKDAKADAAIKRLGPQPENAVTEKARAAEAARVRDRRPVKTVERIADEEQTIKTLEAEIAKLQGELAATRAKFAEGNWETPPKYVGVNAKGQPIDAAGRPVSDHLGYVSPGYPVKK